MEMENKIKIILSATAYFFTLQFELHKDLHNFENFNRVFLKKMIRLKILIKFMVV